MADHINLKDLPTEGERLDFNKVSRYAVILLGIGGIGLVVSLVLLLIPTTQKAYGFSWLLGTVFFFTIGSVEFSGLCSIMLRTRGGGLRCAGCSRMLDR